MLVHGGSLYTVTWSEKIERRDLRPMLDEPKGGVVPPAIYRYEFLEEEPTWFREPLGHVIECEDMMMTTDNVLVTLWSLHFFSVMSALSNQVDLPDFATETNVVVLHDPLSLARLAVFDLTAAVHGIFPPLQPASKPVFPRLSKTKKQDDLERKTWSYSHPEIIRSPPVGVLLILVGGHRARCVVSFSSQSPSGQVPTRVQTAE